MPSKASRLNLSDAVAASFSCRRQLRVTSSREQSSYRNMGPGRGNLAELPWQPNCSPTHERQIPKLRSYQEVTRAISNGAIATLLGAKPENVLKRPDRWNRAQPCYAPTFEVESRYR